VFLERDAIRRIPGSKRSHMRSGRIELLLEEERQIGGDDLSQNQSSRRNILSGFNAANHFRKSAGRTVGSAYAAVAERRSLTDCASQSVAFRLR